ncbi:MAG: response regulator [Spirochaetia bacterium]|nr:response regulator [Spirochaetia bacterium]
MIELKPILLVEDNPNDEELTLSGLAEYNLANDVQIVHDGEEALDYLFKKNKYAKRQNGNPAVILLDLKLPKVDGLEVLRAIRSEEKLKLIPVVILTSSREESDKLESYRHAVNAYVVKPVNFHEFINAIKGLGFFWGIINEPPPGSIRKA